MKGLLIVALTAAALATGLFLFVTPFSATPAKPSQESSAARPAGPAVDPSAGERGEAEALRARVAMLEARIEELAGELETLRSDVHRRPAEAAPAPAADPSALLAVETGTGGLSEAQREAIAEILERAREQEAELRAEERARREEQMIQDRAGRIADELSLAPADRALLAEHLRTEASKRSEIIERSRDPDYDRNLLRDEFVALRDWSEAHLIDTFGADLAGRIRQAERQSRGSSIDRARLRGVGREELDGR